MFASYFRRARYARPGHCELYQQTAVASQTVARESRTEAAWLLCDRQRAPTAGQEAPPRPHEGQPKLRTSAPHWRLRPRPDAAPPKNGENNGRGRPICGLPLDHRRSKSDCDWTPVEDEGDHTPSTDLNSASPFPQSPVLNTWVSSCIIGAPPERAPAGVHSLVMRRKYVLWRCALVCERLRCEPWMGNGGD